MSFGRLCHITFGGFKALNTAIANAGVKIAAAFLAIMVMVVLAQVFFRYVMNDSLVWAEELSKAMMVWMAFLVAPKAMLSGANVKIEMLIEAVPARLRLFLKLLIGLATLWVLAVFLQESIGFWQRGLVVMAASLPVPMAVFYSIVPVGFVALMLAALQIFIEDAQAFASPHLPEDRPEDHFTIGGDGR